ncbi:MAG: hypothetical protein K6F26_07690 [Lachnospiraceae bacterium]|nr:hypothetical protein [Lachnospiraceae bacterium]
MKKRIQVLIALVMASMFSLSVALADYQTTGSFYVNNNSRYFTAGNWISTNKKKSRAWTSGATDTTSQVSVTFYWMNLNTGDFGDESASISASPYASINATEITEPYKIYYKTISDHHGTFQGITSGISDLTTIAN